MRITTLGTSHGDHTYCRFNSSTLVDVGGDLYLIDAGEPVTGLLVRADISPQRLRAVLITHMHSDHVNGLPKLIADVIKNYREGDPISVYIPDARAIEPLNLWVAAQYVPWPSPRFSVRAVREGVVYRDQRAKVTAIGTTHLESDDGRICYAYQLEAEGKRVVFTGDLRGDFADFPRIAREEPIDVCVCEMTHFRPETALPVLHRCRIGRLVLNHIHNPWHGEGEQRLRQILAELPYPFEIAHDGDVFEV